MNFAGYVPLYRGLIEHTLDGRMTNNEFLVFVCLLMLADRKTGSYTINGPILRTYLPGLSKGAAQRALEGLEQKRYIYRDIRPRSPIAYPYYVHRFHVTDGQYRMCQLDLSEVFATKDSSKRRYVRDVPEGKPATEPAGEPATSPEGANYNKMDKREGIHTQETPLCSIGECDTRSALDAQRVSTEGRTHGEACAPQCASTASQLLGNSSSSHDLPPGYELRDGDEGLGVYRSDGIKLPPNMVTLLYEGKLQ